jgi:PsbN protein
MQFDTTVLTIGITSLVIGLTILTLYSSFGPGSKNLLDPFEEDDD